MRLAHLTDLHAGRAEERIAEAMLASVAEAEPDLVVVGGDLTQRSRTSQWRRAVGWLDQLPCRWIATPGNHDIPLFDLPRRIADPFGRFRRHVDHDLEPAAAVDGAFVLCVRTATPKRRVEGAVERESLWLARELLDGRVGHDPIVLVTHHPLAMHPRSNLGSSLVVRGRELLDAARDGGVDLLLSGHTHRPHGGEPFLFDLGGRKAIAMHGGTACSTRLRGGEAPAWQLAELEPGRITLSSLTWDGRGFSQMRPTGWERNGRDWEPAESGFPTGSQDA